MMRFQHPIRIAGIRNLDILVCDADVPRDLVQPRRPGKSLDVHLGN